MLCNINEFSVMNTYNFENKMINLFNELLIYCCITFTYFADFRMEDNPQKKKRKKFEVDYLKHFFSPNFKVLKHKHVLLLKIFPKKSF